MSDPAELRRKLTWIAVFRVSVTTLLLGFLGLRRELGPRVELSTSDSLAFGLMAGVYFLTLGHAIALRRGWVGRGAAYAQVLGDVVVASSVIFLTGAGDSPFTFTYSVAVVAAAILLFQRGALVAAAASTVAFAAVLLAVQFDVASVPVEVHRLSTPRLVFVLTSNGVAQLSIGVLAAYLSRQLAAAGGRVIARDARIEELVGLHNLIVAAMPSGLISADRSGRVTFMNRAAEAILGRAPGQWAATVEDLLPGVLKLPTGIQRAELQVPTPNGSRIVGLTVSVLEEKLGSMLIVFQDLTGLRRAEEQLRTVDHLASLGRFSAQLAHEIRNPLASMRGAAQMLAGETTDSSSARLSRILIRESDRLSALVEDFLRFARPQPPKLECIDLRRLVNDTIEMLKVDPLCRGVRLELIAAPVVFGESDPSQIQQVLINLVRNALTAVGPGGTVRVAVSEANGSPEIRVWDSAGGIPASDLSRIFEPFYTTKSGGTGLGLTTAHTIVRGHGGNITVTSAPADGTEFVVALPPAKEGPSAHPDRR